MAALRIKNGKVYDPANGIDGATREICVVDGRITDQAPPHASVIDAQDRKSTRLNSSHMSESRMPSSA